MAVLLEPFDQSRIKWLRPSKTNTTKKLVGFSNWAQLSQGHTHTETYHLRRPCTQTGWILNIEPIVACKYPRPFQCQTSTLRCHHATSYRYLSVYICSISIQYACLKTEYSHGSQRICHQPSQIALAALQLPHQAPETYVWIYPLNHWVPASVATVFSF